MRVPLPFREMSSTFMFGLLLVIPHSATGQSIEKPPLAWASVSIHSTNPDQHADYSHDQPNGFSDRGMSLLEVISQAYAFSVLPFRQEEVEGLPEWARSPRYDILARVDPEDVDAFKKLSNLSTQETMAAYAARKNTGEMLMVQSLLADRFHLQAHWESRERSVYALTVAKGGLRLKPAADPQHGDMNFGRGHLDGRGVPLAFLAGLLAQPAQRIVVDRTGTAGVYDFDLRFTPADVAGGADAGAADSTYPDLFTAVQEQLGLKLQSTRTSVPVLVIDHVDPPTPN